MLLTLMFFICAHFIFYIFSERRIASFLGAVGQKFLCMYRSCGTYIVVVTILVSVYLVTPNYVSVGYMTLLLFWLIGRQLVEETKRPLWFPLKAYSIAVFIFLYILSIFPSFQLWLSRWMDLYMDLGYDPEASLLQNVWESLAVLTVMQLYSYERRQSEETRVEYSRHGETGLFGFIKRLVIWHSEKILFAALFYAALTPICALGLVYLLALVVFSVLPKSSRIPSKACLVYSGLLMIAEYLYQMLGGQAEMFPGQKHSEVANFLGFRVFKPGFWGLEAGLRGKFVVIAACILQYNTFRWLESMPKEYLNTGKWEEPCLLFVPAEEPSIDENPPSSEPIVKSKKNANTNSNSWPSFNTNQSQSVPPKSGKTEGVGTRKFSFDYIWGSSKESHKWNKKLIHVLKKERFETQKTTLIVYLKFWLENMSNLFGLEINMIVLLLASFAVLNVISMLYIVSLAACILSGRRIIRKVWPVVVALFASVLVLEYIAIWRSSFVQNQNFPSEANLCCHDCWKSSNMYFHYCEYCWLGLIVDDPRMLISYFMVFLFSCFKLRADHSTSFSGSFTYHQMLLQRKNVFVWKDLSFETKSMWTFLDYVRLYCYCHLLDLVLALILVTGTLEYDILHLGYLGFALVFFRMRPEILKKRNKIFRFLRMYNFAVIVLSLVYQSPFLGASSGAKWPKLDHLFEVIGFHKYDYGFRITSTSALVEIVIFMLVALQSFVLSSEEFDHVSRYLEAEQIGAIVREQEKKAAWKTAQLQHIRESEEQKRQRNLQVEKMKAEMLNLQFQLHSLNSGADVSITSPRGAGLRMRSNSLTPVRDTRQIYRDDGGPWKEEQNASFGTVPPFVLNESPVSASSEPSAGESPNLGTENRSSLCEITEINEANIDSILNDKQKAGEAKQKGKENSLSSAVQLIGDGVSHVQLIGNQAVSQLANFLNVPHDDTDSNGHSSTDEGMYDEVESQRLRHQSLGRSVSLLSDTATSDSASPQIGRIIRHIWSQIQSNNDVVCYCCFVLIFLWNFGVLSMVYLAALFMYALCVNTAPSYMFWKIMLIYTEFYILVEYIYQILIQHSGFGFRPNLLLMELGFPTHKITSSFVISSLPLFLVYLFTLIQSSITAKDGEWKPSAYLNSIRRRNLYASKPQVPSTWIRSAMKLLYLIGHVVRKVVRGIYWYWKSLTHGAESSPYFIQLSLDVPSWPEDGIQPETIESGINQMLRIVQEERCKDTCIDHCHSSSRVHVQSIERSVENPSVALAVLEVVYAAPLTGCMRGGWYKSLTPASDVAKEISEAKSAGYVEEIGFPYPILSIIGGGQREVDLYAYIFGADLTVFFLVAIFYQSIIKNNSEFLEVYQLEDQFPKEFVFILIIIFFLIVLDRILYLCSFATGKVLFYIANIVLYTYSVTQYAWYIESSPHHAGRYALRAIFFMKAISLALQAIQIRYGLPHQSTLYCQFLTSEVSWINYMGYRIYRALPFLYELRCVLDWSCTTTSLTMYDWLKLEDIHSSLYLVKCDAVLNRSQHKMGQKQTKMTKFCNGICLFFVLICVIWAPMLMYSSGNPTNMANPIKDASVQVDLKSKGGRLTLFQTTMCEKFLWADIEAGTDLDPLGILSTYDKDDVQLICCQADSSTAWLIPSSVQTRFIRSLKMGMEISITWILNRDRPKGKEIVKYENYVDPLDLPEPSEVQDVLNGTANKFRIMDIYPGYFRVTGSGEVRLFEQQVGSVSADLVLHRDFPEWWSFDSLNFSNMTGCGDLTGPMAIVVSEETPPQGILGDTLSKFSIWGLYITFVLAVGRFVRLQCSDLRMRIPYENLPSCDRLIAICEDIYAARAEGELGVEEVLYWTLVKIYRSPHMLLEYTKVD
uniref:Piezo non-specific cation channel R-Ras-binding domain-containing protein n=1 Tax=Kalanchoe fedtschenkoi TaxID=63787 RepID=A0A7N0TBC5_KALFE